MSEEGETAAEIENRRNKSGVPRKVKVLVVIWFILLILCVFILVSQFIVSLINYLSYPKRTEIDREYGSIPFPAITFCNLEKGSDEWAAFADNKRQLIRECSFNGQDCDVDKDFVTKVDADYGTCFTFNHGDMATNLTSEKVGATGGLRLSVRSLEVDDRPAEGGVRLQIHDKKEYPLPDMFGYDASTGQLTSFAFNLQKTQRLASPYGDCVNGESDDYSYSVELCTRSCFQKLSMDKCGCGDPSYPASQNATKCHVQNTSVRNCVDELSKSLANDTKQCDCQSPCAENIYSVVSSATNGPKDDQTTMRLFYDRLNVDVVREVASYSLHDFLSSLYVWIFFTFILALQLTQLNCRDFWVVPRSHTPPSTSHRTNNQ